MLSLAVGQGPSDMKVTVLDTIGANSAAFFLPKPPHIPPGGHFVDPDFPSHIALGERFSGKYEWKRPHVST